MATTINFTVENFNSAITAEHLDLPAVPPATLDSDILSVTTLTTQQMMDIFKFSSNDNNLAENLADADVSYTCNQIEQKKWVNHNLNPMSNFDPSADASAAGDPAKDKNSEEYVAFVAETTIGEAAAMYTNEATVVSNLEDLGSAIRDTINTMLNTNNGMNNSTSYSSNNIVRGLLEQVCSVAPHRLTGLLDGETHPIPFQVGDSLSWVTQVECANGQAATHPDVNDDDLTRKYRCQINIV